MITAQLIGQIMDSRFKCPNYATVILRLSPVAYTPPVGSACVLKQIPCPYTPPVVV